MAWWPSTPASLARLEWWLWFLTVIFAIAVAIVGWMARETGRQRASLETMELETRLEREKNELKEALAIRDAKASELEQITTAASREMAALKERHKERIISDQQRAKMIAVLSHQKAGSLHMIGAVAGNGEALMFAKDIEKTFKEASWLIHNFASNYISSENHIGAVLLMTSIVNQPTVTQLVLDAFRAANIPIVPKVHSGLPHGTLSIVIGHKPN